MPRRIVVPVVLLTSIVLSVGAFAGAEAKKRAPGKDAGLASVEKVLRAEVSGSVDRRSELAAAIAQHPDSAAARWQAGFVRNGDSWRSFDEPANASEE